LLFSAVDELPVKKARTEDQTPPAAVFKDSAKTLLPASLDDPTVRVGTKPSALFAPPLKQVKDVENQEKARRKITAMNIDSPILAAQLLRRQ